MFDQGPLNQNPPPADLARKEKLQSPLFDFDRPTQQKIQTISLLVLAVLGSTYLIYWLRPVLVPFVVALFVVSGLSPILAVLERTLGVTRMYVQGQFAAITQHRLTGGVGITDLVPNMNFDVTLGGVFENEKSFGDTTAELDGYFVAFGFTFTRPNCCRR